jgi:hypothetical protein
MSTEVANVPPNDRQQLPPFRLERRPRCGHHENFAKEEQQLRTEREYEHRADQRAELRERVVGFR